MTKRRIHQNPTALLESGSFRPIVYSAGVAGLGSAVVFKTSAIDHSATPPFNQINDLIDMGDDHIPVVCVQRNRAPGNSLIQAQRGSRTHPERKADR